jgi:hypothetical protein
MTSVVFCGGYGNVRYCCVKMSNGSSGMRESAISNQSGRRCGIRCVGDTSVGQKRVFLSMRSAESRVWLRSRLGLGLWVWSSARAGGEEVCLEAPRIGFNFPLGYDPLTDMHSPPHAMARPLLASPAFCVLVCRERRFPRCTHSSLAALLPWLCTEHTATYCNILQDILCTPHSIAAF